jgi:hypothetical protein
MSTSDSTLEIPAVEAVVTPPRSKPPRKRESKRGSKRESKRPTERVKKSTDAAAGERVQQQSASKSEAAADDGSASETRKQPLQFSRLAGAVPGWMVSLVVHLALVLILALFTIAPNVERLGTLIEASAATDEAPLVEMLEITPQKLETPEAISTNVTSTDLTMVTVGEVGETATAVVDAGELDVSAGVEIGEIFTSAGGGMMASSNGTTGAQFFGVKASGNKFVFIVDSSNSMKNGKFDAAKEELTYAIRRLSKDQFFYVIFFDQDAARMTFAPNTEPEPFSVPATNENIGKFEKWMATVQNELRTDPYDAVKFAMDMRPDAIYILSDGKFTDRGKTEKYLKVENIIDDPITGRMPIVVVHTVAFWQNDGEETMKAIADNYKGTYRFVPPPKGVNLKPKKKNK